MEKEHQNGSEGYEFHETVLAKRIQQQQERGSGQLGYQGSPTTGIAPIVGAIEKELRLCQIGGDS
jgi:hypothetical protein